MFTGTVKLAQIDDYISPGQNCIQPKIMKKATEPQKATVSLNDCLACSGCVTSAQSVLIEQMSIAKLRAMIEEKKGKEIVVMLAPQVVVALALKYGLKVEEVFGVLVRFFKQKMNVTKVLDLWQGIELAHQLAHQEYLTSKTKTILCSECPGWICYAQKTLNQKIVDLMSRVKSPQQVLGKIVKQRYPQALVVSVMPCYDKKLQAIRFDIEEGVKEVDITITTTELLDLYITVQEQEIRQSVKSKEKTMAGDRLIYHEVPFGFVNDPVSNGYLVDLLGRLKATITKKSQFKNSDFIEYQAELQDGSKVKMAKCYGFRNIQRIVQAVKKGKCQYSYVQIMACPGGCYSGGGQPKVQNSKPKQVSQKCGQLADPLAGQQPVFPLKLQIDAFKAEYKVIEQTLTQAVMNW